MKAARVSIEGSVQGVFFRAWTEEEAVRRGLSGWVRNRRDGSVEALFQGSKAAVDEMLEACRSGPPDARVRRLRELPLGEASLSAGFRVLPTA